LLSHLLCSFGPSLILRAETLSTRIYLTAPVFIEGEAGLAREADFHGSQGRLTLAMLALEHRRPVSRDELAEEIWLDGLPRSWELSVKVLISKIRAALVKVAPGVRIDASSGYYQLTMPRETVIDVELAASRIHAAEATYRRGNIEPAAADALVASMIAARTFLPGFDGPWATSWRTRLVDVRLRALDLLSMVWLERGEPAQAARDAENILVIDPYREEAYRTLMRAHLARGDRAAAANAYRRCIERLALDLGIEPASQTRQLLEDARLANVRDPRSSA
jgi:SARP family transcriptional regulator, regulator of embCAB operon